MHAGDAPEMGFRQLLGRFQRLEEAQEGLKEQMGRLLEAKERAGEGGEAVAEVGAGGWGGVPGSFLVTGPATRVLEQMGHAVHVWKVSSGEIVYWNRSAEKLYGWKDYEAIGQRVTDLLFGEQNYEHVKNILDRLSSGHTWSGQLSFKNRSGSMFMALVTKSPLYENGKLVGVICVSSDAAAFNKISSERLREYHDHRNVHSRTLPVNLKKLQCLPEPQLVSVPLLASPVSSLASKVGLHRHEDGQTNASTNSVGKGPDNKDEKSESPEIAQKLSAMHEGKKSNKEGSKFGFAKPSRLAAKLLKTLQNKGAGALKEYKDESSKQKLNPNDLHVCLESNELKNEPFFRQGSRTMPSNQHTGETRGESHTRSSFMADGSTWLIKTRQRVAFGQDHSVKTASPACHECLRVPEVVNPLPLETFTLDAVVTKQELEDSEVSGARNAVQHSDVKACESSGGSSGCSHRSSSTRGEDETSLKIDCEVQWDDLLLKEEIEKGSTAVVYRGIWNGSDVAIKVYVANEYHEGILHDYRKEINIMRRLRHPNVVLFMGAVYSQERLAIVTEFLPRGSLFRALHRNSQELDIKKRLRMALDVARGMNYLHCRNPPIVHRDLKSSNLLVDKTWTVKVGDFGLSKLKSATFLTTKSGRGTPQWMAPEVLRSEPSNEKSDVFSFGVVLWELTTRSIPWVNLNPLQVVAVVGFMDKRLDLPKNIDPEVSTIISDCWRSKAEQRPSFKEIIQRMTSIIRTTASVPVQRSYEL